MNSESFNNVPPFNNDGAIFMASKRTIENCKVGLLGIPYDGTSCFKPGSRFGPSAIRESSHGIETYCPQLDLDLEDINFTDLGSLDITLGNTISTIKCIKNSTLKLLNHNLKPLIIGGEHSITTGVIEAMIKDYPDLIMLQLDAHADLRDEWSGNKHSHACTMKRCLELLPSQKILQVAIRSGTKSEFKEMNKNKRLIPHTSGESPIHLKKALQQFIGTPIYLTFDLDWFDPSVLPGTGTPEPGGFLWRDFAAIIEVIKEHNLVGADVVELCPIFDTSGISTILAAKVIRSLIMLLDKE